MTLLNTVQYTATELLERSEYEYRMLNRAQENFESGNAEKGMKCENILG